MLCKVDQVIGNGEIRILFDTLDKRIRVCFNFSIDLPEMQTA